MIVYDWIDSHANRTPNKLALLDWDSNRRFTYSDMNERVGSLAGFLRHSLSITKGDRVALLALNSSDVLELQFACARLGAVFVPLNIRLAPAELEYMIQHVEAKVLFCGNEFAEVGIRLEKTCDLEHLVSFSGSGKDCDYETGLRDAELVREIVELEHDDPWIILFTSGTTSRPKGVNLTHGMVFANAVNSNGPSRLTRDSTNLCFLPLFHTGGLNSFANPMFHIGGTNIVLRTLDAPLILELIDRQDLGISHFLGVPSAYQFMAEAAKFDDTNFEGVVTAVVGGAPAPESMLKRYSDAGLKLSQGFGMTEAPMVLVLDAEDSLRKIGSSGKPLLHVDVKLVTDDDTLASVDEIGEIFLKGPSITSSYWQNPDANVKDFSEGWLRTGDAAYCDDEGFYFIVDRKKDMYISGGENVSPAAVENIISQLLAVLEVSVIGVPDDRWGEVGRAFVVLKEGAELSVEDIMHHCTENLAKYKVPKYISFIDDFPRNATGKIVKQELRKIHLEFISE